MITKVIPICLLLPLLLSTSCETSRSGETKNNNPKTDSTLNNENPEPATLKKDTLETKSIEDVPQDITEIDSTANSPDNSITADTVRSNSDVSEQFVQASKEMQALGINQKNIPTVKEIGIKPYPKAYVVKLGTPFEYKGKSYNTMELVTADSTDVVLSFYNKWKENWYYVENSGVHTFKQDREKYFRETNNLQIQPFDLMRHPGIDTLFEFEPKSFIFIYYEVKNLQ